MKGGKDQGKGEWGKVVSNNEQENMMIIKLLLELQINISRAKARKIKANWRIVSAYSKKRWKDQRGAGAVISGFTETPSLSNNDRKLRLQTTIGSQCPEPRIFKSPVWINGKKMKENRNTRWAWFLTARSKRHKINHNRARVVAQW